MAYRLSLALVLLASTGCASSPPAPEPSAPPPRGAALAQAVIGTWAGMAEDGTPSTENVELALASDGGFSLSAGMVNESYQWIVRDDLIVLLPDPGSEAADGICFRAASVTAERIEGQWAYTQRGARADGEILCKEAWHRVTLARRP